MVRYFYAWTPLVVVGTVVLLALPWLGLIALLIFSLAAFAALAALACAVIAAPYFLVRSIGRHWQQQSVARRPSAALSLAERERL
jgi:hypothetical protein